MIAARKFEAVKSITIGNIGCEIESPALDVLPKDNFGLSRSDFPNASECAAW